MKLKFKNEMKENISSNPTKSVHQVYNDVVTKKTQEFNLNANELVKIILCLKISKMVYIKLSTSSFLQIQTQEQI